MEADPERLGGVEGADGGLPDPGQQPLRARLPSPGFPNARTYVRTSRGRTGSATEYLAPYLFATVPPPSRPRLADTATRAEFDAAWTEFFGAIRRARGRAAREVEREGLSLAQFGLLFSFVELERGDVLPVGALAEGAGIAQPTATRMLDGLERQGIVERRPSTADRRSVEVELTARGRRLLNRKRKLVDEKRQAVFESLEAADRESAARLLRTLAAAIEDQL